MSTPEEVAAELAAEQDGRPEWLPDQFKTPEDLAKSYDESRREMDRLRSSLDEERQQFAAALERIEAVQQQPAPAEGLDPRTNQLLTQYQQAVESGDAAAQLAITLGLQQDMMNQALEERFKTLEPKLGEAAQADRTIAFELASERVAKAYGDDWGELKEPVQAWLREHQSWLPAVNDPNAFEVVIREAASTVVNEKAATRLKELEADRAAKLSAATATGSGQGRFPTATDDKKQQWQEIKDAPVISYADMMNRKS